MPDGLLSTAIICILLSCLPGLRLSCYSISGRWHLPRISYSRLIIITQLMLQLQYMYFIANTFEYGRRIIKIRVNATTNQRLRLHDRTHHQWPAVHPLPPSLLRLLVSIDLHTHSTPTANLLGLVRSWRPCDHLLRPRFATAVLGNGQL